MPKHIATAHTRNGLLAGAIKNNDDTLLSELYQQNYFKTRDYVLKNCGSHEQAKDVFQDAFLAVWRNVQLDKFLPEDRSAFAAYLFTVSKHKWIDHLRSEKHINIISIDDLRSTIEPADTLTSDEDVYISEVKKKFEELGDRCREVLRRYYYNKETMKQIANAHQWTEATAKNNKYRCIQQLRSLMNQFNRKS